MKIVENRLTEYLSINVPDDGTPWSSSSTYNYADEVKYENFIYKYAGEDGTNTENDPAAVWSENKDAYSEWVKIKPTNYYAALDGKSSTQTTNANNIIMEFANESFDTISLLNVSASELRIELINTIDESVLYEKDYDMQNTVQIVDERSYWYAPFDFKKEIYEPNLYLVSSTKIKVTLSSPGGTAAVGRIVAGQSIFIGDTLLPATIDQETYSRFDTDIFGNTDLHQRQSVKVQRYEVKAPVEKIPYLNNLRAKLTAKPILFIMDESENSKVNNLLTYGYFTSSPFSVSNAANMTISVNIKGLV